MTSTERIIAVIIFIIAGILLVLSIMHFMEKGVLLNNTYLFASKKERGAMDKRPHYRQSAIVFLLLSLVFAVIGLSVVLQNDKITLLEIPLFIAVIIYAVITSFRGGAQNKR